MTVYAAASLSEAFEDLAAEYEAANPDVDVKLNFAGSARLAAQISAGARADVFASANSATMSRVAAEGRTATPPVLFVRNRLALVVPIDNPGNVTELADLSDDSLVLAMCAPEVPCGALARAVLNDAGVDADADTEETSVRAVLTKVTLGEADAGLVWGPDLALLATDHNNDFEAPAVLRWNLHAALRKDNPLIEEVNRLISTAEFQANVTEHLVKHGIPVRIPFESVHTPADLLAL